MKFRLIQEIDGRLAATEFDDTETNVIAAFIRLGFAMTGRNYNPHNRAELQGQPKFAGLLGPMWDGNAIRYECPAAYRTLSS